MNAEREGTAEAASEAPKAQNDFGGSSGVRAKLTVEGTTYRDLVETLLSVRANPHQPHPVARHVCAVLSAWAHADAAVASRVFAKLGLPDNQCQQIELENAALGLTGSLLLVQSKCRRVALVAYRGLDPHSPAGWSLLADAQPTLVPVPQAGAEARILAVHYRNQRATWNALVEQLEAATKIKSTKQRGKNDKDGLEALFLTGHGSGGASAALAAYRLATSAQPEDKRMLEKLAQVYTFAAPMFGNAPFARSWNEHGALVDRVFCHQFGRDPMPHLPPRGTQTFRHVGKHYAVSSGKAWPEEPGAEPRPASSPFDVVRALAPLLAEQAALPSFDRRGWFGAKSISALAGLLFKDGPAYSFYDHTPMNYVVSSQPKGVLSEFGEHF